MKESGLPVLPTIVRLNSNEILETNLKWDGSQIYGKDSGWYDSPQTNLDQLFLNVNVDQVMSKASEIVDLAESKSIKLSYDHPFDLLFHPDGSWEVITRDIKNTRIGVKIDEHIKENHRQRLRNFRNHLESTKDWIRKLEN